MALRPVSPAVKSTRIYPPSDPSDPDLTCPPPAAMETVVRVYSLESALDLIERRGEEKEVEVKVMGCALSDVPELREALMEKIRERYWGVADLSGLRPFVPVAQDVCSAARILYSLIREDYQPVPLNRLVDAAGARAQEILQLGGRLRDARMKWALGLGKRLVSLGGVMEAQRKRPAVLQSQIKRAHTRCIEVGKTERGLSARSMYGGEGTSYSTSRTFSRTHRRILSSIVTYKTGVGY